MNLGSLLCFAKYHGRKILRRHGKAAFLQQVPVAGTVLDVGCGSDSPFRAKQQRSDIVYIGLDVADFNHTRPAELYADRYIVVPPETFAAEIEGLRSQCDAIISSHNIEHCREQEKVIKAMVDALKEGGRLYLSFPCEESVSFPRRNGTLNFYDDPTHDRVPNYEGVLKQLFAHGMTVDFARKRYRPPVLFLLGLLLEPISMVAQRTMPWLSTWALYGFESVIWAARPASATS